MSEALKDMQTLLARARRLGRAPADAAIAAQTEVLVCQVAGETYALELSQLEAVQPARGIAPVPCTPAFVAGILNLRGEVHPVLHLAVALGLPRESDAADDARVVLVSSPAGRVGLVVGAIVGVRRVDVGALAPPPSQRDFVRGVAEGSLIVLDLARLLTPERFEVFEEVD
jgi:purine-binding chemotaxis protein CheW